MDRICRFQERDMWFDEAYTMSSPNCYLTSSVTAASEDYTDFKPDQIINYIFEEIKCFVISREFIIEVCAQIEKDDGYVDSGNVILYLRNLFNLRWIPDYDITDSDISEFSDIFESDTSESRNISNFSKDTSNFGKDISDVIDLYRRRNMGSRNIYPSNTHNEFEIKDIPDRYICPFTCTMY